MVPVIRLHRTVSKIMNLMNKKKLITILLTLVAMAGLGQELKIDGQEVLLDRDVAELYGVETRDINKAVRNNPDKFPEGYIFTLQHSEKQELVENFHRFETLKHSTVEPHAFTERGLYMLATILKSKQATSTTLAIIDSFYRRPPSGTGQGEAEEPGAAHRGTDERPASR